MENNSLNNFKGLKNKKLRENRFDVPKDYFNSFEDVVMAKLKAEVLYKDEISKIPKDYFETLENDVIQKVTPETKVISLRRRLLKIITPVAVAASIILAIVLTNNSKSVTFDSLTNADLEQWINQETINDAEIATIFLEEELTAIYFETDVTNSEILNYLNQNEIEITYEN
jgi:hypothetical protein